MIITYLRSSSYNNWDFCQLQYYMTYVLGWQSPSGLKAEQGTIVHKVFETLANIKKILQDNPEATVYLDEHIGEIHFSQNSLMDPAFLSDKEIADINKTRINKNIYKSPCLLKKGHFRLGVDLVESIFERAFEYYQTRSIHDWKPVDKRDSNNWMWMGLDFKRGLFDPRKRNIVDAEPHFDIEIDKPWAKYTYITPDGEELSGNLGIKGTIDLITDLGDGILEIVDWKTGQRLDWVNKDRLRETPKKCFAKLSKDPQLMLYYWAAKQLYPNAKHIILTIFFVRDGGPFTLYFDDEDVAKVEKMIENRYLEIKNSKSPRPLDPRRKDFRCTRLCPFFKNKFSSGDEMSMCHKVESEIKEHGIDYTTIKYSKPSHDVGNYENPGE